MQHFGSPHLHPSGGLKSKVTWLFATQSVAGFGACAPKPKPAPDLSVMAFTAAPTWKELWHKCECSTSNAPPHILGLWPDYYCNSTDNVTEQWDKYINMPGVHVQNTTPCIGNYVIPRRYEYFLTKGCYLISWKPMQITHISGCYNKHLLSDVATVSATQGANWECFTYISVTGEEASQWKDTQRLFKRWKSSA
jgi:hypothetical protein